MGNLDSDELVESWIRIYWDLLESVVSPFLDSLPFHDQEGQHVRIPRPVALIRSTLECIGSNLDPQVYFPHLPKVLQDIQREIYEAFDRVLEKLEESVRKDILSLKDELQRDQEAGVAKFPRLSILRVLVRSAHIDNTGQETGQTRCRPLARDYVCIDLNEAPLSVLYTRLESLHNTVSEAFPRILSEAHPTPLEDSIAAAQQAQDFGKVAEALFSAIAKQMDEHCKNEHVGSIRVAVFGKSQVDMLLPLCSKEDGLHPTTCFLSAPLQPTESLKLDPSKDKETSICLRIWTSYRSRQKLGLYFKDSCLWERDFEPERLVPLKRSSLSSFIQGHDKPADETNAGAFTNQSRAEIPVLLAHSMLYLYKTRWFQHLWDMDKLFLWIGKERLLQDQYPYLSCVLSMNESKSTARSILTSDEGNCDPLYRYALVLEFGLRLLEIESGRRFPPNLDEDVDPESDEKVALPFLTLQRALQTLKGKGEVEDDYYDIAKACLDFNKNLKKKKLQDVEAGLREWVALHSLIFSPLLQLLAKKFKGAAADLLELELAAQNATSKVVAARSKSQPAMVKASQREQNELYTIPKGRHASLVKSPLSAVVTTFDMDSISPHTEKSPSISELEKAEFEDAASSTAISGGVRLFDNHDDTFETSIRSYADEFLSKLKAFRERYIKPSKDRPRMRIAILDTGVDEADHYLKSRRKYLLKTREKAGYGPEDDPIKAIETFLGESAIDNNGHGTQIAGILTKVVPEADLYIAKISDQMHVDDVCHIPDAIKWAISQECNIITMSFGIERSAQHQKGLNEIHIAIGNAHDAGILMFAAASNCGANGSRTYPAWDTRVICVHALDGRGSPSRSLNPSVDDFPGDNFGTLGVAIKCSWQNKIVYKTGTSFATPVAAGIAALVLEYMDQSYGLKEVDEEWYRTFRQCHGMQQIFRRFMSQEMGNCGYRFVAPWIFWDPELYTDKDIWSSLRTRYVPHA